MTLLVSVTGAVGLFFGFIGTVGYLNRTQPQQPKVVETEIFKAGMGQSRFLRSGWHPPESWGTWSNGSRAELEWQWQWQWQRTPTSDPLVSITGRIFPYVAAIPQKISVVINDKKVAVMERNDDGELYGRTFRIPQSVAAARNPMRVIFEISHPTTPSMVSNSTDERRLGLGLESIEISYEID